MTEVAVRSRRLVLVATVLGLTPAAAVISPTPAWACSCVYPSNAPELWRVQT